MQLTKRDFVIIGSGGLAKEIRFLVSQEFIDINRLFYRHFLGYIDTYFNKTIHNEPVIGNDDWLLSRQFATDVFFGIGNPLVVQTLVEKYSQNKFLKFPNLFHSHVIGDFDNINLGEGNIFTAGTIFTTDIKIGNFNIFNLNTTVGHDVNIGNYNLFNPGCNISGNVTIENTCLFGTGCQVLAKLNIPSYTTIGSGAVLTKSILNEYGVYVGIPAIRRSENWH